jgi:malate synthase
MENDAESSLYTELAKLKGLKNQLSTAKGNITKLSKRLEEIENSSFQQQIVSLDDRIAKLNSDLLAKTNDLQSKVDSLQKELVEQKRLSFQNSIVDLELYVSAWIHDNSGRHLPYPPHRLIPTQSPETCFSNIQVRLMRTREQLEQANDLDKMEIIYQDLLKQINEILADFNLPSLKWVN